MTLVAQGASGEETIPFWNNRVLDAWEVPFGSWMEELVDWIVANMGVVLGVIEWPFSFLFRNFVNGPEYHPWWEITDMSWALVCGGVVVVAAFTRNLRVGIGLALILALCGLLGDEFWDETSLTVGLIIVAVVMCAIIGIPLGVLCGRIDGVWNSVRPVLDAMQVVHPFVYIIPVIFFFGLGPEPATMVTMIFAIPPLIRLTNLGIRQVPADVVEASRAYGASEWRVLLDVQLPLARPAVMTGLNQTLLLSISMLGIAAIMGASGLGLLVFRAVTNVDTRLSTSAGLALFIVAVVLDRISQRDDRDASGLLRRIRLAWAHRRDPETLLEEATEEQTTPETVSEGAPAPVGAVERIGILIAMIGGLISLVALFLPWSNDSGLVSGFGRERDLDLIGSSFNGMAASGGSFFGIAIAGMCLLILGGTITTLVRTHRTGPWLGADATLLAAASATVAAGSYLWLEPTPGAVAYSDGIGPWIALIGAVAALAGSVLWMVSAPYSSRRPLPVRASIARIVVAILTVGLLLAAGLSSWTVDRRASAVLTPELQEEITRLEQEAREDPSKQSANVATIGSIVARAQRQNPIVSDGFSESGSGLGYLALGLGLIALLSTLPAAGLFGADERNRWRWGAAVSALGMGIMVISAGWIGSLVRISDGNYISGVGAFLTLLCGFVLFVLFRPVLNQFGRTTVYAGDALLDTAAAKDSTRMPIPSTETV